MSSRNPMYKTINGRKWQAISRGNSDVVFGNRKRYHDIGYLTKIYPDGKLENGNKAYVLYVIKSKELEKALRKTK